MRFKLVFSKVRVFVLAILAGVLLFGGGYYLGVKGYRAEVSRALHISINRQTPPDKNVDMSLFWQVWDTITSKYYDKTKLVPGNMVYGAIGGMVSSLGDPYTMFLPPAQNKVVNEDLSGSFEGVGIEIGYKNTRLAVISPLNGSPAERAGVKAGDYIVRIKDMARGIDIDAQNLNLSEAVADIRGSAGTKVTLTLVRDGDSNPIVVDLVREKIDVPSVSLSFVSKDSNIANIKLSKFDSRTVGEWDKAVKEINTKCQMTNAKCKGIIIDLRNNPGGYLQAAIDIASDFLPSGSTVVVQQNGDGTKEDFKTDRINHLANIKVVILINGGSASASEILAGALRDVLKIQLVGEKSFGKGTIQEPLDIAGGSGLHVTTAKWLTPNGTWVHEKGLEPDVKIVPKDGDMGDIQLQGAIDLFK